LKKEYRINFKHSKECEDISGEGQNYQNQIGKAPAFKYGDEPILLLQNQDFFGKIYLYEHMFEKMKM
jgi:hypothetical protein